MPQLRARSQGVAFNPGRTIDGFFQGTCVWPECLEEIDVIDAPLCKRHLVRTYVICQEAYLWALEPEVLDDRTGIAIKPPASKRRVLPPEQGNVYFVRLGNLVKIGFTTNMTRRMQDVPHEEILGIAPGTKVDERQCHAAFAHLRATGEWFRAEPELLAFIADVTK